MPLRICMATRERHHPLGPVGRIFLKPEITL